MVFKYTRRGSAEIIMTRVRYLRNQGVTELKKEWVVKGVGDTVWNVQENQLTDFDEGFTYLFESGLLEDIDGESFRIIDSPTEQNSHIPRKLPMSSSGGKSSNKKKLWDYWWVRKLLLPFIVGIVVLIVGYLIIEYLEDMKQKQESAVSEVVIPQLPDHSGQTGPKQQPARTEELSLEIVQVADKKELESVLSQLRESNGLRALLSLETGKKVGQTPVGTFFYVSRVYLDYREYSYTQNYLEQMRENAIVDNTRKPTWYHDFEIHHLSQDSLYILGFVSLDAAASISRLDGATKKEVVVASYPWETLTTLVLLPVRRIVQADDRRITTEQGNEVHVLDIIIK